MANIPANVIDKSLYRSVKLEADKRFEQPTSAYKSMWIVKEYKRRGGKYSGRKEKTSGTTRWRAENWIQVIPYLLDGKREACGEDDNTKACRPLVRVSDDTPPTLPELIRKHGRKKLIELAKKKQADMDIRVDWINASAQ